MFDDFLLIVYKEWRNFRAADRSVFLIYGIMVLFYSFVFTNSLTGQDQLSGILWWLFFSVVGSSTFMNLVFVGERTGGQLEILLTSGVSRNAIVAGKVAFVTGMALAVGFLPLGLASVWGRLLSNAGWIEGELDFSWWGPALYLCASMTNASVAAWLSLRLSNPRMVHFVNFLVLTIVVMIYALINVPLWLMALILVGIGAGALVGALRAIHSERVVQPVNL